jgi:hypothetical protein
LLRSLYTFVHKLPYTSNNSFIYVNHHNQLGSLWQKCFNAKKPFYKHQGANCGVIMKIKATIDRFEEDKAILVVGENKDDHIVPHTTLPHSVIAGLWLLVDVEDNRVINAIIDEEETTKVKERLARFKQLGHIPGNVKDKL